MIWGWKEVGKGRYHGKCREVTTSIPLPLLEPASNKAMFMQSNRSQNVETVHGVLLSPMGHKWCKLAHYSLKAAQSFNLQLPKIGGG